MKPSLPQVIKEPEAMAVSASGIRVSRRRGGVGEPRATGRRVERRGAKSGGRTRGVSAGDCARAVCLLLNQRRCALRTPSGGGMLLTSEKSLLLVLSLPFSGPRGAPRRGTA
jgi:hypothetical protein